MIVNAGIYNISVVPNKIITEGFSSTKVITKNLIKITKQQTFHPIEPLGVAP